MNFRDFLKKGEQEAHDQKQEEQDNSGTPPNDGAGSDAEDKSGEGTE